MGRKIGGGTADATCFSFYATKNLTTGEGGMLTGARALVEARGLGVSSAAVERASNPIRSSRSRRWPATPISGTSSPR